MARSFSARRPVLFLRCWFSIPSMRTRRTRTFELSYIVTSSRLLDGAEVSSVPFALTMEERQTSPRDARSSRLIALISFAFVKNHHSIDDGDQEHLAKEERRSEFYKKPHEDQPDDTVALRLNKAAKHKSVKVIRKNILHRPNRTVKTQDVIHMYVYYCRISELSLVTLTYRPSQPPPPAPGVELYNPQGSSR
ncbi:hypothetical protein ARMSODRAFT_352 [Armillaria solidipes]|uniref:Uncharacterized protein n=1 Tax=Armillaria solidipes TaxID=1076256 RepID=A0A2H3C6V5_9AGAR|nr:hypothetical protein ARMSODRAFT_352 [Armillaria solidipes]